MQMTKRGNLLVTYGDYKEMVSPAVKDLLHSYWGLHYDSLPDDHNWCMMNQCAIFWQEVTAKDGDKFVQPVGWTNCTYWLDNEMIFEELCIHPIVQHNIVHYVDMLIPMLRRCELYIIQDKRLQEHLWNWEDATTYLEFKGDNYGF